MRCGRPDDSGGPCSTRSHSASHSRSGLLQPLQHPRQNQPIANHHHHPGVCKGMGGEARQAGQQWQLLFRKGRVGDDGVHAAGCHQTVQVRHRGGVQRGGLVRRPGQYVRQGRRLLGPGRSPARTRSTARFMVLASPLNTRSTALFCTSGGRSTCLDAALYLIRHCVTASRSAGTAGPSSDSTRLTSETSLVGDSNQFRSLSLGNIPQMCGVFFGRPRPPGHRILGHEVSGLSLFVLVHVAERDVLVTKVLKRVFGIVEDLIPGLYAGLHASLQPVQPVDDLAPPDDDRTSEPVRADAGQQAGLIAPGSVGGRPAPEN